MNKSIIFHYPQPIVTGGASGGQMRPAHMVAAFKAIGYEVDVVAGYGVERQNAIQQVVREVNAGKRYMFAYAETINKPLLLAERLHLNEAGYTNGDYIRSLRNHTPWQDFVFFRWLQNRQIPIGMFCRDVYWQFQFFQQKMSWSQRNFHRLLYLSDWRRFRQFVDHLFVPDMAMEPMLPQSWPTTSISALPPGAELHHLRENAAQFEKPLKLFYVGGIVPPRYDLMNGFEAVAQTADVEFTVCCRPHEWARWQSYYRPSERVRIVHGQGGDLARYYQEADIFCMVREPFDYWRYTIPIKIFEAIGYGLPIILLAGTPAADFVSQHNIGWVVDHVEDLPRLLANLQLNRDEITHKRNHVARVRQSQTWLVRAQTAAGVLSK